MNSAATLADEFLLTHRASFPVTNEQPRASVVMQPARKKCSYQKVNRDCYYCHKKGHVIADCFLLNNKSVPAHQSPVSPKGFGAILAEPEKPETPGLCFEPFIFNGLFLLAGTQRISIVCIF